MNKLYDLVFNLDVTTIDNLVTIRVFSLVLSHCHLGLKISQ